MKRIALIFLVVLCTIFASAQAQIQAQNDPPTWQVFVFDEAAGELLKITPDGIESAFPSEDFEPLYAAFGDYNNLTGRYATVAITGDHMAAMVTGSAGYSEILVANLAEPDGCCRYLENPIPFYLSASDWEIAEMGVGGISPAGEVIVLYYVTEIPGGQNYATYSEVILMDVATGAMVGGNALGGDDNVGPRFYYWDEAGLHYDAICFLCTHGVILYEHHLEFTSDGASPSVDVGYVEFGIVLPATGEVLAAGYDRTYPILEVDGPIGIRPNVIRYQPTLEEAPISIFYDTERFPSVPDPHWVMDGRAFLIEGDGMSALVTRDGTAEVFDRPAGIFLIGTPEGWLVYQRDTGAVLHYTAPDTFTELGQVATDAILRVVSPAPLGINQDLPPFMPIE